MRPRAIKNFVRSRFLYNHATFNYIMLFIYIIYNVISEYFITLNIQICKI